MKSKHLLLAAFTLLLLISRIWLTASFAYLFLIWNLFLAWLPLYFAKKLAETKQQQTKLLLFGATLLFLPNAPYLLTDLFHLGKQRQAPLWLDTILLSSFALLGALLYMESCRLFFRALQQSISYKYMPLVKYSIMLLSGYGIYLGRYLRFNSWDVIAQPITLARSIWNSLFSIEHLKQSAPITLCFALFLFLLYEMYIAKYDDAELSN